MAKATNPNEVVVALDVGRSGVKIAFMFKNEVKTHFIPSVVIPAKAITFDTNAKATSDNTIEIDGVRYFVGETAIEQGARESVGLSSNWLNSIEHRALLLRSQKLLKSYGVVPKLIVAGLPVDTFDSFKKMLFDQVTAIFACNVLPVPQPWGVYQDCLLNNDGRYISANASASKEKFAVIDIGHFTTDILLMSNYNWIQESSGSTIGMSKACTELGSMLASEGISTTAIECQEIIKTKAIKEFGVMRDVSEMVDRAVNVTRLQVVQAATNLLGTHARTIDHIVIAGGGALCMIDDFKKLWPISSMAENPRFSVALGMRKFGINQAINDPSNLD